MHCGEEIDQLQEKHPNAFLLLCQIARRARWKDCMITGLAVGESLIGDWKTAGLPSKKAYQVAKLRLEKCGLVDFQGGNKGTRARLLNTTIFSLSQSDRGNQKDTPADPKGEPEGNRGGTIHTEQTETPNTRRGDPRPPLLDVDPLDGIPESNRPQFLKLEQMVQSLKKEWRSALGREEYEHLRENARCLQSQTTEDWETLREWLFAKIEQGDANQKPSKRVWFLKSPAGYFESAIGWKRKQRPAQKSWEKENYQQAPPSAEERAKAADMSASMFGQFLPKNGRLPTEIVRVNS